MNLIVIVLDTLRYDMVHHLGVDWIKTPCMDKLAGESVIFENCYGEAEPTIPVRRALMTGMRSFPWRYDYDVMGLWPSGRGWHKIPPEQPTMAEILLKKGYTTGIIGDTYHIFKPTMNFTRGFVSFDWVRGQESDNWKSGPLSAINLSKYSKPDADPRQVRLLVQYLLNNKDRKTEADWTCAQVLLRGAEWLKDNAENKPFLLWLECFDPHEPWDPPTAYADMYAPKPAGPELIHAHMNDNLTPAERERVKALYAGEVTLVDKYVGVLLDKVDELGMRKDTIVMLISDHGCELFDHGGLHKSASGLHPYNTQLVWFIRHPKAEIKDHRVKALVQNHDLFLTALALLGVEGGKVDGENVWPLVTGEKKSVRDHVITGWGEFASVRDEEWNYIVNYEAKDAKPRLFHHTDDPKEDHDVAAAHPDVIEKQRKRLEALLGQPLPAKLTDKTYPSEGPFIAQYANLIKAGRLTPPKTKKER
ncbi:MAG: sulfatase [Planctomycetota bacterium]